MKMRYIVAGYTVAVVLLLYFVCTEMTKENQFDVDMVYYNRQLKQVEAELESLFIEGKSVSETEESGAVWEETVRRIETDYHCIVLFRQSENYGQRLNELICEGAVIFDYFHNGELTGKIAWEMAKNRYESLSRKRAEAVFIIFAVLTVAGYLLLAVIYYLFIRPFHVLERFSTDVAKGNLDFSLPMEKRNMFGAFTESFDIMREELKNAREREYQANISKKELVAELSHDIKTPVSTIKATCEVMQITEKNQDTLHKIDVIINKADMIDQLMAMLTGMLFAFAGGLVVLGEIDDNVAKYIMITPVGMRGYLSSRIVIPALISGALTLVLVPLFSLVHIGLARLIVMVMSTMLSGIVTALLVVAISSNKVEGMAVGKLSGLFGMVLFVPYVVTGTMKYAFCLFPMFWIGE